MPAVTMVSRWADSDHDVFVRNAARLKAIWFRNEADDFRISRIHTGPHFGQYEVAIQFSGWKAFGDASERVNQDEEFAAMMAASFNNGRMVERTFSVDVPLE